MVVGMPLSPVGQHPHAMPPAPALRLLKVAVKLLDVRRVGIEARSRTDPPLHLNEGVERGQVDRRPSAEGRRLFLDNLVALCEIREDEEITYGGGYIGLRLVQIVSPEDFTQPRPGSARRSDQDARPFKGPSRGLNIPPHHRPCVLARQGNPIPKFSTIPLCALHALCGESLYARPARSPLSRPGLTGVGKMGLQL